MAWTYDKNGNCVDCGLPGNGFVSDGVCDCPGHPLGRLDGYTPTWGVQSGSEQLLSAHDLEEVQVIMSNHIPSGRDVAQRREMARQFYGDY